MNVKIVIFHKEFTNSFSLMPASIIYPEINDLPLEPKDDLYENFQETRGIPFLRFHHTMQSMERIYPPEHIQSLLMLASGRNIGLGPLFCPHPTELRMEAEARLVFKKDDPFTFASYDEVEFFFNSSRNLLTPSSDA